MCSKNLIVSYVIAATMLLAAYVVVKPSMAQPHTEKDYTVGAHVLNCIETSGHHVFKTEMTCPLGGQEFEALVLGTHSTYGVSLDWEPASYLRFPVPLPVCPSSGFIIVEENMTGAEVDRIAAAVESSEYQSLYAQRHATYFLYAKLTEMLDEGEADRWWYYRQATSEADVCQAPKRYRQYALATIAHGEKRLSQLSSAESEYWILSIVIPNMYRRIGEFDEALEWLARFNEASVGKDEADPLFALGHKLLRQAIAEKRTERVLIENED